MSDDVNRAIDEYNIEIAKLDRQQALIEKLSVISIVLLCISIGVKTWFSLQS
jgi:hypothetical protein